MTVMLPHWRRPVSLCGVRATAFFCAVGPVRAHDVSLFPKKKDPQIIMRTATSASPAVHSSFSPALPGVRTCVVDTSVLLSDPFCLSKFGPHDVVVPLPVISELEAKRHHPELGWCAREALRALEGFRATFDRLDEPFPVNVEGGTVRVELVSATGDDAVLNCALDLRDEGCDVVVVSKDIPLRVRAGSCGVDADEYRAQDVVFTGYSGMVDLCDEQVPVGLIDALYAHHRADLPEALADAPIHCGVRVHSNGQSALARVGHKELVAVDGQRQAFGLRGRSAQQRLALDLLADPGVGIVSLGGKAGTGKSALALCAGLEAVMERGEQDRILVFRPLYAVGGQSLGYLPGSEDEKMNPWAQAVFDTLGGLVSSNVMEEVAARNLLEVLPLTHIRGRTLHRAFVIVDEAQSLERTVLLTVLSRLGEGSKVVLTHDVAQRDNLRVGRHDGVQAVIEKLKGHELFAHVTLQRSERSAIAELVTSLLEGE